MGKLLLCLIYIAFISLGLPDALLGAAWPDMHLAFGVSASYAGIVSMMIAGSTILSSLFCDKLIFKFGTGKLTAISVALTAAALYGFSVSGSFVALCLIAIPYGLGAGAVDAALNNFVALHYQAKHMNWLHCFWGIGASLGPYIMGSLLGRGYAWNIGYRSVAILQVILTFVLILSLPLWKNQGVHLKDDITVFAPVKWRKLLRLPSAKPVLLSFFCYCSVETAAGLWSGIYLVLVKNISADKAAFMVGLFYFGITAGRFISGFLTLRIANKNLVRIGQAMLLMGVLLLFISNSVAMLCAALLLVGLGCAPIYPTLLHQTVDYFGVEFSQSMMGMQMASAYVGSTISPIIIGFIAAYTGNRILPFTLAIFLLIMIGMTEYCSRKAKNKEH